MLGALTLVFVVAATLSALVVIVLVIDRTRELDSTYPEWVR